MQKLILTTLLLLISHPWLAEPVSAQNTVTCESVRGRTTRCRIDARRGRDVRLIRQLSTGTCDNKWYYDDGYIIVTDGCRAVFQAYGGGSHNDRRYQQYRNVPQIGEFIIDRTSYYDERNVREFDALVNNYRERWWVNCRTFKLGTGNRYVSSNRVTDEIVDFVCTDRYNNRGNSRSRDDRYDDRY